MPTYEYQCGKCGTFEVSQRITEPALRKCPTCKGKVSKLISSTSFQLKGSGWYVTDYASKGSGGDKKKDSKSDAKPEAKGESSSTSTTKESKGSNDSSSGGGKTEATAA
jgi:putative FmdB family regulatory protein